MPPSADLLRHKTPDVLAAVDLGSNSFHLIVARNVGGQLVVIDKLREMVRLGQGVDERGQLDKVAARRAIACLERFGQRLAELHAGQVRAVGTNALRQAHGKAGFLKRAREALGHPIEIVSGREEARLIYAGVAHTSRPEPGRRLVVDIGGGSTEMIIGEGTEPLELESLRLGCVSMSAAAFPEGRMTARRFAAARIIAQQELEPVQERYRALGWDSALGSAGTARAVFEALREIQPRTTAITPEGCEALIATLCRVGDIRKLSLASVSEERRAVLPGGLAVLVEVLRQLGIREMRVADGGLREGLLYDMVGRLTDEDARERTVRSMQLRYHVDRPHAGRVEETALELLSGIRTASDLEDPQAAQALRWAARLHEIGLDVAHSGYHRHGAYLLDNADMPGFAREEQHLLARLVGAHRRKLSVEGLEKLIPPWNERALWLIVVLRLAVVLHRGRNANELPSPRLQRRGRSLALGFSARWLRRHPLTQADLQQEAEHLEAQGLRLRVVTD
ncbi:MAG: hypothetical protein RL026_1284 [Pseudomonadota bacterium]